MDYEKYLVDCEYLQSKGFIKKTLFFQTGGGEDENDIDIFVRGDNALTFGWDSPERWSLGIYGKCNYVQGFDTSSEIINIYKDLKFS